MIEKNSETWTVYMNNYCSSVWQQFLNTTITFTSSSFPKMTNELGSKRRRFAKHKRTDIWPALFQTTKSLGWTALSKTSWKIQGQRSSFGLEGATKTLTTYGILLMGNPSGTMLFPGPPVNRGDHCNRCITGSVSVWSLMVAAQDGSWMTVLRHMAIFVSPRVG